MDVDKKIISAIDYYDTIADKYNKEIDEDYNTVTRAIVKRYIKSINGIKNVLDFGGGTGKDLIWLLEANLFVTFYEPSKKMADEAQKYINFKPLNILNTNIGNNATYKNLRKNKIGYDLILSNFAAINSIKNIVELFGVFSNIIDKNGHVVVMLFKNKSFSNRLKTLFFPSQVITRIIQFEDKSSGMIAYMHTKKQVIKAAKHNGFSLFNIKELTEAGFLLYHFVKQ